MDPEAKMALEAREKAYVPYSNFGVGCVLRTKSGKYFKGCNVENGGIQSICAERVAFTKAISEGEKEFESIVVCGAKVGKPIEKKCLPCGYCRQFISEFVEPDFKVKIWDGSKIHSYTIREILPETFFLHEY